MPELILNALIFGVILSVGLAIIMLVSFLIAPDMWVGDQTPDIKEQYGEMSPRAKSYRPFITLIFFGSIIVTLIISLIYLHDLTAGNVEFMEVFLSSFITLMVFNTFDLLIADWLVFVTIQPKAITLPGTEGMAGYKDYRFHFRGFLVGIGFSAIGALVFSLVAVVLVSLLQ